MPTPAEAAQQLVSTPEGRQRAVALLLGIERIAHRIGWKYCTGCQDWVYPTHPCTCGAMAATCPHGEESAA